MTWLATALWLFVMAVTLLLLWCLCLCLLRWWSRRAPAASSDRAEQDSRIRKAQAALDRAQGRPQDPEPDSVDSVQGTIFADAETTARLPPLGTRDRVERLRQLEREAHDAWCDPRRRQESRS